MKLYKLIAKEYSKIFPSSIEKVEFIKGQLGGSMNSQMLDIGCASGEFDFQLAPYFETITGIDLDDDMITEAKALRKDHELNNISFIKSDMLGYLDNVNSNSIDLITCLGNTLVYVKDKSELWTFLESTYTALKTKGRLIIQILNYSNPEIIPGFEFPVAESKSIKLQRSYKSGSDYEFHTRIVDKKNNTSHTDIHNHLPIQSSEIEFLALELGYSAVSCYGNYNQKKAETNDFFHVLVLTK